MFVKAKIAPDGLTPPSESPCTEPVLKHSNLRFNPRNQCIIASANRPPKARLKLIIILKAPQEERKQWKPVES
jgi:hypothetical protein